MNDILILASLLDAPKHGYLIKKAAGLILGQGELHNNLVYPLLHRFERRGWVGKRKSRGQRGQTRLEYYLTPRGRAQLIRRLEDYSDSEDSGAEFYLRAGLLDILPRPARSNILSARERELEGLSRRLDRIASGLRPKGYAGEVLNFLRRKTRFELKWVRTLSPANTSKNGKPRRSRISGRRG
jgi:DNA-binding PadR family transcriptional regulator